MTITKSIHSFRKLLDQVPWDKMHETKDFLGENIIDEVDMYSSQDDLIVSVTGVDASQRQIGVGIIKFGLIRAVYLDKQKPLEKNFTVLLVPPKIEGYAPFLKAQFEKIFEEIPAFKFLDIKSTNEKVFNDLSKHELRDLMELSAHLCSFGHSEKPEQQKILLIDGYIKSSYLNNFHYPKIAINDFCDEFLLHRVFTCGIIKEGHILDQAFYLANKRTWINKENERLFVFKINSEVVERRAPKGLLEDLVDSDVIKENSSAFTYFIVFAKGISTIPVMVQLSRNLSKEDQNRILREVIKASRDSHPLLAYPQILNEAHNVSYIGRTETELLEQELKLKLNKEEKDSPNIDQIFEVVRAAREKTR